ncbi:homeodomain-interacting protein kinase 2-like [Xyrichtys novacula]|uniref:Homeodomain-interacting protein kinase 2-like n=1 Tax=Xyrichtys novacula TaxID=13765 RepID=A0AAV1FN51_XYRNO|nr:homeodomain-interacting protein kinase 2-like [Xyrichtys novacula]
MPKEYAVAGEVDSDQPSCLDNLVDIYPKEGEAEFQDRKAFVDLLKGLLHLESDKIE